MSNSIRAIASLFLLAAALTQPLSAQHVSAAEMISQPLLEADHCITYGADSVQFGDLRLPDGPGPHPQAAPAIHPARGTETDTVHVAPPTGEREADRASILAALQEVRPGGVVRFAAGRYLIGEIISVAVPEVVLVGHPDGTTLRGCNPAEFQPESARDDCNGLELAGARQTVRGFTFEYTHWALHLGCCQGERALLRAPDGSLVEGPAIYRTEGGHRVEGNTFRRSRSGIRMNGDWTEPAIVRNNRFIDNWHSVSINGSTVHLLDNDFSVPEPERVPFDGFPWDAIKIGPPLPLQGPDSTNARACTGNVIAGNRIEGAPDGIRIEIYEPGTSCRDNVIRDNTIVVRRVTAPSPERTFTLSDPSDSTFVGVPLSLLNYPEAFGQNRDGQESLLEDNRIEGNRIIGAHGLGIEILNASRNRIENNTISGILARKPFPGNALGPRGESGALEWVEADGSGIWVSPGSDENEIVDNIFEDVTGHTIVLEGNRNRVETASARDGVHDLGTGNRVSGPAGAPARTPPSGGYSWSFAGLMSANGREESTPSSFCIAACNAVPRHSGGRTRLGRPDPLIAFPLPGSSWRDAARSPPR